MFKRSLVLITLMISTISFSVRALTAQEEFRDPTGKFKITLIGDWRAVSYSDAVGRQKTEFVYRDRREGLLRLTKEAVNGTVAEMVRAEEENLRTYRVGFERASTEPFGGGALRGLRFSFYSTDGGRQTASTYYYLQDGNSVWILRFVGKRGTLDAIRNLTDQMARSFNALNE